MLLIVVSIISPKIEIYSDNLYPSIYAFFSVMYVVLKIFKEFASLFTYMGFNFLLLFS